MAGRFISTNWTGAGRPRWAADFRSRDHLVPGGVRLDSASFARDAWLVTLTAAAAAGATTLAVAALPRKVEAGTILYFGTAGQIARVNADAAAGATTLAVDAIPTALALGAVARVEYYTNAYGDVERGKKFIPSGTAVVKNAANDLYRRATTGDAAAAVFLTAFDVEDADDNPDAVLYRPGSVVKGNLLPGGGINALVADVQTALRSRYVVMMGGVS